MIIKTCFTHLRCALGRWPEKSVKFILRLLKNAEANADSKGLELEELYIKNVVVQQAPVCSLHSINPIIHIADSPHFVRKHAEGHTEPMDELTRTKATPVT